MPSSARFATSLLIAISGIVPLAIHAADAPSKNDATLVYVGSYTRKTSKGVYGFKFNAASGKLTFRWDSRRRIHVPFFDRPQTPTANFSTPPMSASSTKWMGTKVSTFSIDQATRSTLRCSSAPSPAATRPAHVLIDPSGKVAIVNKTTAAETWRCFPSWLMARWVSPTWSISTLDHGGNAKRQPEPASASRHPYRRRQVRHYDRQRKRSGDGLSLRRRQGNHHPQRSAPRSRKSPPTRPGTSCCTPTASSPT